MRTIASAIVAAVMLSLVGCSKPEPHLDTRVAVFLHDGITDEQRGAVDQQLRGMPRIRGVGFESKQQAYEHTLALKKLPATEGVFVQLDPGATRGSYRFSMSLRARASLEQFMALSRTRGVASVLTVPVSALQPAGSARPRTASMTEGAPLTGSTAALRTQYATT